MVSLNVDEVLLALDVLDAEVPVGSLSLLALEGNHSEGLLLSHTNVHAVAAAEAVHDADLDTEVHALHGSGSLHFPCLGSEASLLLVVEDERTDTAVGADESTLVTLDTLGCIPLRDKS